MAKAKDLTGQQLHYLTVLHRVDSRVKGEPRWLVRCICGKEYAVDAGDIIRKRYPTKSCGCQRVNLIRASRTTHGMSRHPAFGVWHSMKQRCEDPNHRAYHNYGGRGISVCPEWAASFENFWRDMRSTYHSGLELDRINNNKGYNPQNCRWVDRKTNSRNRRVSRLIDTPLGQMTVAELCERTGIGETTMLYRLNHDWPTELLCVKPDARNLSTTSGIVVRGTDSQYGITEKLES